MWLGTYAKRIKLTTDNSKIDSNLSHFPLTVFLGAGNGETTKVFDEITTSNLKMAVTKTDGTTQLYVEIEKWDNPNQVGILHCGITGDTLASAADTDYYLYYDSAQDNNTTYVGVTDSVVAESVWDSNFKMVQHLVDATTSTVKDSTSNDNDGTKASANNPLVTTSGKIGNAQDFSSDNISAGSGASIDGLFIGGGTVEAWIYRHTNSSWARILNKNTDGWGNNGWTFYTTSSQDPFEPAFIYGWGTPNVNRGRWDINALPCSLNTWYHLVVVYNDGSTDNDPIFYVNGVAQTTVEGQTPAGEVHSDAAQNLLIGSSVGGDNFDGIIDEVRCSDTIRAAAWIKATYNSTNDSLLTYGTEETIAAGNTTNFFQFFN